MKKFLKAEFYYDGWIDPSLDEALRKTMEAYGWKETGAGQWCVTGQERRDISYEKEETV